MAKEATKSFVLRIDAEMMEAIERWAEDEFRSTNGQLQYIIAEALRKSGRIKKKKKECWKLLILYRSCVRLITAYRSICGVYALGA